MFASYWLWQRHWSQTDQLKARQHQSQTAQRSTNYNSSSCSRTTPPLHPSSWLIGLIKGQAESLLPSGPVAAGTILPFHWRNYLQPPPGLCPADTLTCSWGRAALWGSGPPLIQSNFLHRNFNLRHSRSQQTGGIFEIRAFGPNTASLFIRLI